MNKTAPAPLDTLSAKRNSSTEPQRGNEDNLSKNQNISTTCQLELAPIISRQAETNLDHRIPGTWRLNCELIFSVFIFYVASNN